MDSVDLPSIGDATKVNKFNSGLAKVMTNKAAPPGSYVNTNKRCPSASLDGGTIPSPKEDSSHYDILMDSITDLLLEASFENTTAIE